MQLAKTYIRTVVYTRQVYVTHVYRGVVFALLLQAIIVMVLRLLARRRQQLTAAYASR